MAGIGIDFQSVCPERKLTVGISGFAYVALPAAAPMLLVAAALALMQRLNGYSEAAYDKRELFVCTVQYIFVFSLLTSSVVRPVLSACLFDAIYEKRLDNLFPAYSMGLLLSLLFAAVPGIPFCFREWAMGGVPAFYVFAGYCGYMLLNIVLVNTACLLDFHDYERVCAAFLFGLLAGTGVSVCADWTFCFPFCCHSTRPFFSSRPWNAPSCNAIAAGTAATIRSFCAAA